MKSSFALLATYTLLMSRTASSMPVLDLRSLESRDPTPADHASALYAYIVEDSELERNKEKRENDASALYAYIVEDSELDQIKAKRENDASALYAYIVHDSELED
ncbi:hypothetical protein UA08_06866 [Talaromyces atroroseus]|uniref:Uncharacterized protein n=1 Tax=Talaromyces atroroseus TaxID=1441469 RepID=A0A225AIN1_TALAT|nr:hypothetical protein UA08_06866 [Talaromyces atroroseus]OKL58114.1 hypothetical protein UA08_06866 [Talaromyces atroroseus]